MFVITEIMKRPVFHSINTKRIPNVSQ